MFNEPFYVSNQNITIELEGITNTDKITLVYDVCTAKQEFVLSKAYPNLSMYLPLYTTIKSKISNQIKIPHIQNIFQEIFWIYSLILALLKRLPVKSPVIPP